MNMFVAGNNTELVSARESVISNPGIPEKIEMSFVRTCIICMHIYLL